MTTSGIIGGVQYAGNNVLLVTRNSSGSFASGDNFIFDTVINSGNCPCSLDTSTGVFTCALVGTYILNMSPGLGVNGGLGITGSIFVNGVLYHTAYCGNTNAAYFGGQFSMSIFSVLLVQAPGTTFTINISNTASDTLAIRNGATGSRGNVLYIA